MVGGFPDLEPEVVRREDGPADMVGSDEVDLNRASRTGESCERALCTTLSRCPANGHRLSDRTNGGFSIALLPLTKASHE